MSSDDKEVNNYQLDPRKRERFYTNINNANKKYEAYASKNIPNLPEIKSVVYNRIFYPIIYEIDKFYYLGGEHTYFILKTKCHLRNTGKSYYYEAIATVEDEVMGKSPIIPVACPYHKKKYNLKDGSAFKIKV